MADFEEVEEDSYRHMYVVESEFGYFGVICKTYEDANMLARSLGIDPDMIKEMPVVAFQRDTEEGD